MTMKDKPNDLLLLSGKVLTIFMQATMAIGAAGVIFAIGAVLFWREGIADEIAAETAAALGPFPVLPAIGVLLLVLLIIAAVFMFFGKLRAIIATVGQGDPFEPENAGRLTKMAWLLLGVYIAMIPASGLGLLVMKWAEPLENVDANVDVSMDPTGLLLVIVLFILARVFKHGAAMREDLEGTV